MKNERLLLFLLAIVQFSHILDFMIIMPLGSQFMRIFEISPQQFSLIVSSYAFSAMIFGLLSAMYIDRFDRKWALIYAYIGFIVGTLACALAPSYAFFLLARSLTGAFGGILAGLVLAIVGDVIPLERRGQAMGYVMTAFSVASVVGVPAGIFLAATFSWQVPFLAVVGISLVALALIYFNVPSMVSHLDASKPKHKPLQAFTSILNNPNQLRALAFTIILMLGHFTIIPFIAPYMQLNIGFSDYEVSYIYLVGGILTIFLLPFFGKLADLYGHIKVFTISSLFALASIFVITNLPEVSIILALCATSSFFVVASGRSVPATTLITSVVKPENRGSFMSIRTSANEMALALSSFVAGMIIYERPDGSLANYEYVGYIAIAMSLLAIFFARRLKSIS
ncbi:MAG: MFS transporter [Bacteroidota bacterium]